MIPRSRPPTAHFVPRRSGRDASSHETKNASASRWAIVGSERDMEKANRKIGVRVHARPACRRVRGAQNVARVGRQPAARTRGDPRSIPLRRFTGVAVQKNFGTYPKLERGFYWPLSTSGFL